MKQYDRGEGSYNFQEAVAQTTGTQTLSPKKKKKAEQLKACFQSLQRGAGLKKKIMSKLASNRPAAK